MQIKVRLDDRAVKEKLSIIERVLHSPKKPLKNTEKELMEYFGETVFNREGDPKPWKPLAPSTMLARSKGWGYYSKNPQQRGKTLVWTGNLRKSFKSKLGRFKLTIKNTADYFRKHQLGEGKTPKRPILTASKRVEDIVLKNFERYFAKIMNK